MLNISILSLITLILISQNIILLNEETLILICFITFIWLLSSKIGLSVKQDLDNQASNVHNYLENSFNQLLISMRGELQTQNEFQSLIYNFELLKEHLLKLNSTVSHKLKKFMINRYQESFKKKLIFTQRLENQTSKLLALLVIKKLNKAVSLKAYYLNVFQLPILICAYKVSLREYFEEV
uniref:Atp4 n=1 Tax=Gelidiella flabella TaxID=2026927 RepID=A0A7G9IW74_9FLOR|nr:Atp4 [Gelidiella flabella]QNM39618.1 Atp4 [Gelidiella flabella]